MPDDVRRLVLRIEDDQADAQQLADLTDALRDHLIRHGWPESTPETPAGSRAIELAALGTLALSLLQSDLPAAVVAAVTAWLGDRRTRSVRLEIDGDVLELTGVGNAEQRRLTDLWLGRRTPAPAGARRALIVAAYQFTDPGLSRLRAPAHDAEALAQVLGDPAIGDFDVTTLINQPAPVVAEAIEEFFADRAPDDLLVLHFSGHGVKDGDGELYFATSATKLHRLAATAVSADFVNRRMNRTRSRRVVLLLDCCYAGAFGRGMVPRAGGDLDVRDHFGGHGRAVITASKATEYAFEGAELADSDPTPSVFTSALVDGLRTGDADLDQDGYVGLDELYDYVYDQVRRTTPQQTPGKWTFDVQGDLRIARRGRPIAVPSALPDEVQAAVDSPLAVVRTGVVAELSRLLQGRHGGLALAARLALERLTADDSRTVSAAAATALGSPAPATTAFPTEQPVAVTTGRPDPVPRQLRRPATVDPPARAAADPTGPAARDEPAAGRRTTGVLAVASAAMILLYLVADTVAAPQIYETLPAFGHPAVYVLTGLWLVLLLPSALVLAVSPADPHARQAAWAAAATTAAGLIGSLGTIVYWAPDAIPMLWLVWFLLIGLLALAAVAVDAPVAGPRVVAYAAMAVLPLLALGTTLLPKATSVYPPEGVAVGFLIVVLTAQLAAGIMRGRAGASWAVIGCGLPVSAAAAVNAMVAPQGYTAMLPSHVALAGVLIVGTTLVGEDDWRRILCLRAAVIAALLVVDDYVNSSSDFDGIQTSATTVTLMIVAAAGSAAAAWLTARHNARR